MLILEPVIITDCVKICRTEKIYLPTALKCAIIKTVFLKGSLLLWVTGKIILLI